MAGVIISSGEGMVDDAAASGGGEMAVAGAGAAVLATAGALGTTMLFDLGAGMARGELRGGAGELLAVAASRALVLLSASLRKACRMASVRFVSVVTTGGGVCAERSRAPVSVAPRESRHGRTTRRWLGLRIERMEVIFTSFSWLKPGVYLWAPRICRLRKGFSLLEIVWWLTREVLGRAQTVGEWERLLWRAQARVRSPF